MPCHSLQDVSVGGEDAASDNDAFWKFASALFANQPVTPSTLSTVADDAGISGTAFATCYANSSTTLDSRITADRQNALDMGATGAPFSIMVTNGKNPTVLDGATNINGSTFGQITTTGSFRGPTPRIGQLAARLNF